MIDKFRNRYYFLSNMYPCKIEYNGLIFDSSESLFQSMKCEDKNDVSRFVGIDGYTAKKIGKKVKLIKDWDELKVDLMYKVVKMKFEQNYDLKLMLLATKNEHLEEKNYWGDDFWGTVNGYGRNELGKILMKVRQEFLNEI